MSNEFRPSEVAGLTAFQKLRARTEGYSDGFTAPPLSPAAIAARTHELLAAGERLMNKLTGGK